jgi:capsular exopolysaccharide synthesis family protein
MSKKARSQPIITNPEDANNYSPLKLSAYSPASVTPKVTNNNYYYWPSLGTILIHRLRLIALVTVGVTTAVGVWTLRQPQQYRGQFQLLVELGQEQPSLEKVVLEGQIPADGEGNQSTAIDYDSQIKVLRSPKILKPIIGELAQEGYPQLDYKNLVGLSGTREQALKITRLENTKVLEVSYQDRDPQKIIFILKKISDAYLNYGLKSRQTELNQGIEFVKNQLPQLNRQIEQHQQQLQKFRQQHNLINPEQQANYFSQQLVNLETQALETQAKLQETQALVTRLQEQLGVNSQQALAASYLSESPRYQNILNQLQEVEIQLAKESVVFLEDSPVIATLKEKKANLIPLLQAEAHKALGNNLSEQVNNSPDLASPSSVRSNLNQQFIQTTNQLELLKMRSQVLATQIETVKEQIKQMPTLTRKYNELQRQIELANNSLNRFLDAQEKLQIDAAQKASPWSIIAEPTVSEKPISPKPIPNLSLGMLAGLILGIFTAFLTEKLTPKFHSPRQLKQLTQLPLLGLIPWQKNLKKEQLSLGLEVFNFGLDSPPNFLSVNGRKRQRYNYANFWESFHSLTTNLYLLTSEITLKSIVISSFDCGEGKSTVSLYLAQAAATLGKKVLLIEADLRKPSYANQLNITYSPGLSNVIRNNLGLDLAIQKISEWENLSILTGGDIAADAVKLLASERMQQIIEQLYQDNRYDLIIYDTPPLGGFADAKILAAMTQGIILVTKMEKTNCNTLQNSLDDLGFSRIPVLGLVANGVSYRYDNFSDYRHYYH